METKKILGLDLGTNSIGWAVVKESENNDSEIVKIGVRTIHYDNFVNSESKKECMTPEKDFLGGKSISCNAGRTQLRGMRRNLQRYKKRRELLIQYLVESGLIFSNSTLTEVGNKTTFETIALRAKAAVEQISLEQFARVLLIINKKRGYKSSRKVKSSEDGQFIDGMAIAKMLYDEKITPGEMNLRFLKDGKKSLPSYYRSDLYQEFEMIWQKQQTFYTELNENLYEQVKGANRKATYAILASVLDIVGEKRTTKGLDLKKENAQWRVYGLTQQLSKEQLVVVLQEINGDINASSGYLGAIGDRSKELYFNHQTVGQYQYTQLQANPHYSLKNQVFYRQDYLDEFETIWECQAQYHQELTAELKHKIRDIAIFYQRPLRSKKSELAVCELCRTTKNITTEDGKTKQIIVGPKVCPKSSPLFQEFKIWQILNNVKIEKNNEIRRLTEDEMLLLHQELSWCKELSSTRVADILKNGNKSVSIKVTNYDKLEGNRTLSALLDVYIQILEELGVEIDTKKMNTATLINRIQDEFKQHHITEGKNLFTIDYTKEHTKESPWDNQGIMQLWHLLYSYEGDKSVSGNDSLIEKLQKDFGFNEYGAKALANVQLDDDYSNLSARAIRKILPFLQAGNQYDVACQYAGFKHSKRSLTKVELAQKHYVNQLELIPHNSLRNPVVEKILNQMINVVNAVVNRYGKLDEIRIELARDLKKSATERKEWASAVKEGEEYNARIRKILEAEYGMIHISRTDIVRYKLYEELKNNGYKTLYSNTYIPHEKVFSKEFDIEHIIPQAKLFDDSLSNKTLEVRAINIEKGKMTALDFIKQKYNADGLDSYKTRVESLVNDGSLSKAKGKKLLMSEADIPSGFIDRDLRDSQYIARKAREILEQMVPIVVSTTGSVTDRLREDWQLVDIMKELSWDKYAAIGQTEYYQDKDGRTIGRILDWTKRNDNRHHAMDALTIAFTKPAYIQYLNNLNARIEKGIDDFIDLDMVELADLSKEQRSSVIYAIEKKYLERHNGKLRFISPMPLAKFRQEAKKQLDSTLVSVKARNKVTTLNRYVIADKNGGKKKKAQTPRGSLHNDTIYGQILVEVVKVEKIGASFDKDKILTVCNPQIRELLLTRLNNYGGNPKKAFTGSNSLSKRPILLNGATQKMVPEEVKTKTYETQYTIRKPITPDIKIDKVINKHIREILQKRLAEYHGDAKAAFSNLEEHPIWYNQEAGITLRRVTIRGVNVATALHTKHDNKGAEILDSSHNPILTDFVSTSNNHHVAIFRDTNGVLQEHVVSFYEAVTCANMGLPIIDKEYNKDLGWQFLFTMKQNEFFVFPNPETGFFPEEIDLMDESNYARISPNLFRVQKLTTRDYTFRHHLETSVEDKKELNGIAYKRLGLNGLLGAVKVRLNHLGLIVSVGEY